MSFTFVCVLRSGGVFTPQWVERLCRQAAEHLKPSALVALMDELHDPWFDWIRPFPLHHNWPGWFSKLELFRPGLFSGPCVYADLDTLLCGPIPSLASQVTYRGTLMMLDDFFAPQRPASGFMAWTPGPETERIYHEFSADPVKAMQTRHGDGGWIGRYPHERLQRVFPRTFASYKAHKLHNTHAGFPVVCFHGKPKQHELPPDSWARRHWEGL